MFANHEPWCDRACPYEDDRPCDCTHRLPGQKPPPDWDGDSRKFWRKRHFEERAADEPAHEYLHVEALLGTPFSIEMRPWYSARDRAIDPAATYFCIHPMGLDGDTITFVAAKDGLHVLDHCRFEAR